MQANVLNLQGEDEILTEGKAEASHQGEQDHVGLYGEYKHFQTFSQINMLFESEHKLLFEHHLNSLYVCNEFFFFYVYYNIKQF